METPGGSAKISNVSAASDEDPGGVGIKELAT
jgi:hypothetical protein